MISETHILKVEPRGSGVAQQARGRAGKWSLWRAGLVLMGASLGLWGLIIFALSAAI
ncbi:MAG: hypothetical protein GVY13_04210 [Alphaproteobacteria bacterium]|jgi:hypothetical protein|nr:hypothetical protein [Alphaproteobacteria bacterium]